MTAPRERRRAPRAIAAFPIRLQPKEGSSPATLKDLSTIGLCCTTPQRLSELTLLGIDLQLPGQQAMHSIKGAVVRCEPARDAPGQFEVAVFFTEIAPAAKAALASYVAAAAPA